MKDNTSNLLLKIHIKCNLTGGWFCNWQADNHYLMTVLIKCCSCMKHCSVQLDAASTAKNGWLFYNSLVTRVSLASNLDTMVVLFVRYTQLCNDMIMTTTHSSAEYLLPLLFECLYMFTIVQLLCFIADDRCWHYYIQSTCRYHCVY